MEKDELAGRRMEEDGLLRMGEDGLLRMEEDGLIRLIDTGRKGVEGNKNTHL